MGRRFELKPWQKGEIALARTIASLNSDIKARKTAIAKRENRFMGEMEYRTLFSNLIITFAGEENIGRFEDCRLEGKNFYCTFSPVTLFGYNQFLGKVIAYFDKGFKFNESVEKAKEEVKDYPRLFTGHYIKPYLKQSTPELKEGIHEILDLVERTMGHDKRVKPYNIDIVYANNERNDSGKNPVKNPPISIKPASNPGKTMENSFISSDLVNKVTLPDLGKSKDDEPLTLFNSPITADGGFADRYGNPLKQENGKILRENGTRYDGPVYTADGDLLVPEAEEDIK